jgi:hypothetical protein
MSKHWNLSQEQELVAARLTRDAVETLTTAPSAAGSKSGNVALDLSSSSLTPTFSSLSLVSMGVPSSVSPRTVLLR